MDMEKNMMNKCEKLDCFGVASALPRNDIPRNDKPSLALSLRGDSSLWLGINSAIPRENEGTLKEGGSKSLSLKHLLIKGLTKSC